MSLRILFLSAWFPYPPDNGSRIRIFNLLRALSRRHTVTLLSFLNHERGREWLGVLQDFCRQVEVIPGREFRPWSFRALGGIFSPWPRFLLDVYSQKMRNLLEQALAEYPCDVVIGSELKMLPYLNGLPGIPTILEDLEVSLALDPLYGRQSKLRSLWAELSRRKFLRFMRQQLEHELSGCTVSSDLERTKVLRIVPNLEQLAVVPNAVTFERYQGDFGVPLPDTVTFAGALSYFANFDAMKFFLTDVWPIVRARRSGARLFITGRTEGVSLEHLPLDESVTLTGYLADIRPQIARSQVCIAPLRQGGGTRLKILEALALGTPVVATSKGAEGLAVTPGDDILLADEPAEFANAVIRLLDDKTLRAKLATNGRQLVEKRYSWEESAQALERLLCRVVEQK